MNLKSCLFLFYSYLTLGETHILVFPPTVESQSLLEPSEISETETIEEELKSKQHLLLTPQLQSEKSISQSEFISIQGGKTEWTELTLGNLSLNDPINPSRQGDLNLQPENHFSYELKTGSESPSFGGNINLSPQAVTTKKTKVQTQFGSYNYQNYQISTENLKNNQFYRLNLYHTSETGISLAKDQTSDEQDGSKKQGVALFTGRKLKGNWDLFTSYLRQKKSLDRFGGKNGDDPNYSSKEKELIAQSNWHNRFDFWEPSLHYGFLDITRDYENLPDPTSEEYFIGTYKSRKHSSRFNQNFFIPSIKISLQTEINFEEGRFNETFKSGAWEFNQNFSNVRQRSRTISLKPHYYVNSHLTVEGLVKVNDEQNFEKDVEYSTSLDFHSESKLSFVKTEYAHKTLSPSLYQQYSQYGNQNLLKQSGDFFQASSQQNILPRLTFMQSVFYNNFFDYIDYDYETSKFKNKSRTTIQGFNLGYKTDLSNRLHFRQNYEKIKTKDLLTNFPLLHRPAYVLINSLELEKPDIYTASIDFKTEGKRDDYDFNDNKKVTLKSVNFLELNWKHYLKSGFAYSLKTTNALNENNALISGYRRDARRAFLGLEYVY